MKKILFAAAALSAALSVLPSCSREGIETLENVGKESEITIEVYNAEFDRTKNSVDGEGVVYWQPGDAISVFFGPISSTFRSYNSKPTTRANFVGSVIVTTGYNAEEQADGEEYTYWGVYPHITHEFQYIPSKVEDGVACFVDENQTAVKNTFDKATFVTVARSNDYSSLGFYNLCGGVRFKLASEGIDMVTFEGNGGEVLGGEVIVKMDGEGHPFAAQTLQDVHKIKLRAPQGETFKPGEWYYIVTLPQELPEGFTMRFISTADRKVAVRKVESAVKVERSVFGSLDCPDKNLQFGYYDGGDAREVDNTISLKSVSMSAEGKFSFEVGYPSLYIRNLLESVGFKVSLDRYSSQPVERLSESLYMVDINYGAEEPGPDVLIGLSLEDQILVSSMLEYGNIPSRILFGSNSGTFVDLNEIFPSGGGYYANFEYFGFDGEYSLFLHKYDEDADGIFENVRIIGIKDTASEGIRATVYADLSGMGITYSTEFRKKWMYGGQYFAMFFSNSYGEDYHFVVVPRAGKVLSASFSCRYDSRVIEVGDSVFLLANEGGEDYKIYKLTFTGAEALFELKSTLYGPIERIVEMPSENAAVILKYGTNSDYYCILAADGTVSYEKLPFNPENVFGQQISPDGSAIIAFEINSEKKGLIVYWCQFVPSKTNRLFFPLTQDYSGYSYGTGMFNGHWCALVSFRGKDGSSISYIIDFIAGEILSVRGEVETRYDYNLNCNVILADAVESEGNIADFKINDELSWD